MDKLCCGLPVIYTFYRTRSGKQVVKARITDKNGIEYQATGSWWGQAIENLNTCYNSQKETVRNAFGN